jgi:hypothetical protein
MKNQYFGDVRDLFKYDLIQQILKEVGSLQRFAFIPMLTKNDPRRRDGNKRAFDKAEERGRPGTKNDDLIKFLKQYKEIDRDKRDFTEIENYFKSKSIKMVIYKGKGHKYFDHITRDEYFKNIPEGFLHKSLVFVDPDIGLQINHSTEKHLLDCEVKYLYAHMDENSILMIYQHLPRARRKYPQYSPAGRSSELEKEIGDSPSYISDNEILFLFLTKNDELKRQLERIADRYKSDYPNWIRLRGDKSQK